MDKKLYLSTDGGETYKEITCAPVKELLSDKRLPNPIPDWAIDKTFKRLISKDNNILVFEDGFSFETDGDLSDLLIDRNYTVLPDGQGFKLKLW